MRDVPHPQLGAPVIRRLLLDQLDVPSALLHYHLDQLTDDQLFWEPSATVWTMHRSADGWSPDWAETEPDPIPVPTIAWLTWHVGWWWSVASAHLTGATPPDRLDVDWPGRAAEIGPWLTGVEEDYRSALQACPDLDATTSFPWPPEAGRTLADTAAWVAVELTKNAAEIGLLRLLRP